MMQDFLKTLYKGRLFPVFGPKNVKTIRTKVALVVTRYIQILFIFFSNKSIRLSQTEVVEIQGI